MIKRIVVSCLCISLLAGCALRPDAPPKGPLSMIYSPNGEPLNGGALGRPTCEEAYGAWFDRLDVAHTGALTETAFLADAERQFAQMDLNKDGVLTAAVLEKARLPFRQYAADPSRRERTIDQDRRGPDRGGRHERPVGEQFGEQVQQDPVMAADTNLDFKVTRDEYIFHAKRVFAALDAKHTHVWNRKAVFSFCEKPR